MQEVKGYSASGYKMSIHRMAAAQTGAATGRMQATFGAFELPEA